MGMDLGSILQNVTAAEMGACDAINIVIKSSPCIEVQSLLGGPGDSDRGWTPVSWAAYNGHLEVVEMLAMLSGLCQQLDTQNSGGVWKRQVSVATIRPQLSALVDREL